MLLASGWMINLKVLIINDCEPVNEEHTGDDLNNFVRAMETSTPHLEFFQWSIPYLYDDDEDYPRFDTFKNLKHLRNLHLDVRLLIPLEDTRLEILADPYAVFPPSLENLTLDTFSISHMHRLIKGFHLEIKKTDNMTEALSSRLAKVTTKFPPLKHLSLVIDMEQDVAPMEEDASETGDDCIMTMYELNPSDVVFLRYAADELKKMGIALEVFRAGGLYELVKLLIRAGWTAPLPHSVILD